MIVSKKLPETIGASLSRIPEVLKSESGVVLAVLFGSFARKKIMPLSDVDIAILLEDKVKNLESQRELIFSCISKVLKTDEIDLIILNEAPVELCYNIIQEGQIVFCRDEKRKIEFIERVIKEYLDTVYIRDEHRFHLLKRIKEGRFVGDQKRYFRNIERIRNFTESSRGS